LLHPTTVATTTVVAVAIIAAYTATKRRKTNVFQKVLFGLLEMKCDSKNLFQKTHYKKPIPKNIIYALEKLFQKSFLESFFQNVCIS